MKPTRRRAIGHLSAPTSQLVSPLRPVNGSTGWRRKHGQSLLREPARPTAEFMPWKAIPPDAWGLPDYLGWQWRSQGDIPIVCVPGCPVQPDNFMETLLYLLHMAAGRAPMIPLDDALRPTWLFGATVHEGCDRGGYYEQAQFAEEYGSPLCIVKLGCWGPVVQCNVGKRGWMAGLGGCPNVGGICIGCTMPGFPDKFMPFMNQPPGSLLSSAAVQTYGRAIHALRRFTQASLNKEPTWRHRHHVRAIRMVPGRIADGGRRATEHAASGVKNVFRLREPFENRRAARVSSLTPTQPCRISPKRKLCFSTSPEYLPSRLESASGSFHSKWASTGCGCTRAKPRGQIPCFVGADTGGCLHGLSRPGYQRGVCEPAD